MIIIYNDGRLVSPKREEAALTAEINAALRRGITVFCHGQTLEFPYIKIGDGPIERIADDIPDGLFTGPGARLTIEEPTQITAMSHYTKKERIEILETKVGLLKENLNKVNEAYQHMAEQFQSYIGKKLQQAHLEGFPGTVRPAEGEIYTGEIVGKKDPVLCWIAAGKWHYATASYNPRKLSDSHEDSALTWYKKIS